LDSGQHYKTFLAHNKRERERERNKEGEGGRERERKGEIDR
jgi:hypothetical protein